MSVVNLHQEKLKRMSDVRLLEEQRRVGKILSTDFNYIQAQWCKSVLIEIYIRTSDTTIRNLCIEGIKGINYVVQSKKW